MRQIHPVSEEIHHASSECPFTIRQINSTTHLIRENDGFGEFPHIYVKKCSQLNTDAPITSVFVINDTGVGSSLSRHGQTDASWNIKSFIEHHLNPDGDIPYLVILSHCHYDHILGLQSLLQPQTETDAHANEPVPRVQIVSSDQDRSFSSPYTHLQEHSLCNDLGITAPEYETSMWATDHAPLVYNHPSGVAMHLPITTLCTPGHTPDSLSWFDTEERMLYVGDSFYQQQSPDSRNAPWGPEGSAPILFTKESNLRDWWQSLNRQMKFVEQRDQDLTQSVKLAAGHVTAEVNALEFLLDVKDFMTKVLRGELTFTRQQDKRGEAFGHWSDHQDDTFSLGAPLRVVEEGRQRIPEKEWRLVNDLVIRRTSALRMTLRYAGCYT
ncbi:hypothetical protein J1614_008894 [Plenodomus biglobosus]|nr:hypothetical protein J1614_008894 [Plenodomus biglobosus]